MLKKKIDAQILNSTQLYIEAEDLLKKVNNILVWYIIKLIKI